MLAYPYGDSYIAIIDSLLVINFRGQKNRVHENHKTQFPSSNLCKTHNYYVWRPNIWLPYECAELFTHCVIPTPFPREYPYINALFSSRQGFLKKLIRE